MQTVLVGRVGHRLRQAAAPWDRRIGFDPLVKDHSDELAGAAAGDRRDCRRHERRDGRLVEVEAGGDDDPSVGQTDQHEAVFGMEAEKVRNGVDEVTRPVDL